MNIKEKIGKGVGETKRILRLSRKPKTSEYTETMKVTGIGLLAIGLLGFIILLSSELLRSL
jgi:protein transport protein SEC61 subunit gamma-like protein